MNSTLKGKPGKNNNRHCSVKTLFGPSLLCCLFLLYLAACGNAGPTCSLTYTDNGKTIQVHTGDQVVICLDENPTTGFLWAIDHTDTTILTQQNSGYTPTPGGAIGSGGRHVFVFNAKNTGTVQLQLKYWRSFEGNSSIIKRFNVTIQVQ
jgi:inhibitor of cysteine peptidase